MKRVDARRANGYRRDALRNRVSTMGLPCALCGQPIDYSLPAGHPLSYELDEIIPVSLGGDPLDPCNVQPAHRICNERRHNKTMEQWIVEQRAKNTNTIPPPHPTTDW